jgi:hypothetical protein
MPARKGTIFADISLTTVGAMPKTGALKGVPVHEAYKNPFNASGSSPTEAGLDFICECHVSVFVLRPISPAAFEWVESNLSPDPQVFGNAVAVDHHCIWAILFGIQDRGLSVVPR